MKNRVILYTEEDFSHMRRVGALSALILDKVEGIIKPGTTTNQINKFVHEMTLENGAVPAPLNYHKFPKSVCTSVNDVICHGIPDETVLKDGDIINVDVTCILNGYYGDTSRTFFVGDSFKEEGKNKLQKRLAKTTYDAMMYAISVVRPGALLGDIGRIIEPLAKKEGFSVVSDFCGHGTGKSFHQFPNVLHCSMPYPESKLVIQKGMIFTIEPMINAGNKACKIDKKDGWTVRTVDGSLSAQFEHTIGVTEDGCEIFTLSKTYKGPKLS